MSEYKYNRCVFSEEQGSCEFCDLRHTPGCAQAPCGAGTCFKFKLPLRVIVCAAIRLGDKVIIGNRHYDSLMSRVLIQTPEEDWSKAEQGFVDNKGVFLTREEAWFVAKDANQIIRRIPCKEGVLYSEHLY